MHKKITYILISAIFFISGCNSLGEVKRGLTGEKKKSTDEFLVQKKAPLILPPDYENLPTPDERSVAKDELSTFEKTLATSIEKNSSKSGSVESSILEKIKSK